MDLATTEVARPDLFLWLGAVRSNDVLEAWAIAGWVIVLGIHMPGRGILSRNISADKLSITVTRHHTVYPLLDSAHDEISKVDRHVLVVHLRFTTTQEIGQIDG